MFLGVGRVRLSLSLRQRLKVQTLLRRERLGFPPEYPREEGDILLGRRLRLMGSVFIRVLVEGHFAAWGAKIVGSVLILARAAWRVIRVHFHLAYGIDCCRHFEVLLVAGSQLLISPIEGCSHPSRSRGANPRQDATAWLASNAGSWSPPRQS